MTEWRLLTILNVVGVDAAHTVEQPGLVVAA